MENNNEILIEPMIFHGPGGCPKCGGPLVVADSEITLMELDTNGIPISDETSVRCEAACLHCGERVKMVRWKMGYIPYTRSSLILKKMQMLDEIKKRVDNENKDRFNGKNPLAIDLE